MLIKIGLNEEAKIPHETKAMDCLNRYLKRSGLNSDDYRVIKQIFIHEIETPVHLTIFKYTTMEPKIRKEMKYILHYSDAREDVLPAPHGTNTICSVK